MVEDDRAARKAIRFILKTNGFSVTEAGTVAEAMGALAQRPDWVLLDLMLPDGCGTDVLRKLRAEGPPSKVCVITGCGPQKIEEVRVLGPDLILKKPLDVEGLLAALNSDTVTYQRIEPGSSVR